MTYRPLPDAFPEFEAGEWRLRATREADASDWYALLVDPLAFSSTSAAPPRDVEAVRASITALREAFLAKTELRWAIASPAADRMMGSIGFFDFASKDRRVELGYWLAREIWGQGVATSAAGAVVEYGFSVLGLQRIQATVMDGNVASMRVLEKVGFEREGLLRGYKDVRGEQRNFWMFGIVRA